MAETEPCLAPSGYHDDGDPMLCTAPEGHDGDHSVDGVTWEPGTLAIDGETEPEVMAIHEAVAKALRDFGYPTVTAAEIAAIDRHVSCGVESTGRDVIDLVARRMLAEARGEDG